jgi:hypothetical protein
LGIYFDFLLNSWKKIAENFTGHNIPGILKDGKLVFDQNAIAQSGQGMDSSIKGFTHGFPIGEILSLVEE